MIAAVAIVVTVNGSLVPATPTQPAQIISGTVVAPAEPFARRIATAASIDPSRGAIVMERGDRRIELRTGHSTAWTGSAAIALPIAPYVRGETLIIPLAVVARALGAHVRYVGAEHVLEIETEPPAPLATMTPYRPGAPAVAPTALFTPQPPSPSPRPTVSGTPLPRRTPIPVRPSWP
jgi:hypothetical protein